MSRELNEFPTTRQRQLLRRAVRDLAKQLGYVEGMEEYEMNRNLQELLRGSRKLPIWENPEDGYKAILPPRTRVHRPEE